MADTLDVLTFDEAKEAVGKGAGDSTEAAVLARYVTNVSRLFDQRFGPVVARSISGEDHPDAECSSEILLRFRPVSAVATVTEYPTTTGTVLTLWEFTSQPDIGYQLWPYPPQAALFDGTVTRMAGRRPSRFRGPVRVTYTAGRYSSTTAVDARFKNAAVICLENLWRDRQQSAGQFGEFETPIASFPTFALPRAAEELLSDEAWYQRPAQVW